MTKQIREMFAKSLNMSEVTTTDMTVEKVTTQQTGICLHPAHNHCAKLRVWPKTRPSKTRPAQPNYRPGPAGLGGQIFALRPKIRPGPSRCYLIPLSSDMTPCSPHRPQQGL